MSSGREELGQMRRSMDERRPHCMVEGAGMAECNGMYRLVRSHQDSPWTMQFKHVDNPSLKIVRCKANGQWGWVLGQEGKAFYGKRTEELIPPQRGWRNFKGELPRPTVTLRIKDEPRDDADDTQSSGIELTSMAHARNRSRGIKGFVILNLPQKGVDGLTYDCGPNPFSAANDKFLSYAYAQEQLDDLHPRKLVESDIAGVKTKKEEFPCFSTELGSHNPCCPGLSEFREFGVGVVLYFKFLKLMMYLFLVLTIICGVFPIMFFIQAGKMNTAELGLKSLGLTTIGNLGEGDTVCAKAPVNVDNPKILLQCASGVIGLITHAKWGLPTGECKCPVAQEPSTTDLSCAPLVNLACPAGSFCHKGRDPNENKECCSNSKFSDGRGDLTALEIRDNSTCKSTWAEHIVKGMCLGRASCEVDLTPGRNFTWKMVPNLAPCPDPSTSYVNETDSSQWCRAALDGGGDFSQCGIVPKSAIFRGKCYDQYVNLPNPLNDWALQPVKKSIVAAVCSSLDFVGVIVFLLAVALLMRREKLEVDDIDENTTTASDYTIYLPSLPKFDLPGENEKYERILKATLKQHFEELLSEEEQIGDTHFNKIKVADIIFGYNDSKIIEQYKARGKIVTKLELALANQAECDARNRKYYAEQYKLEAKGYVEELQKMDVEISTMEQEKKTPVCAYITFEEEEGFERAVVAYPNTTCHWCCQTEKYRIEMPDGQHWRLKVRPAPEPGNIIWENLEYDGNSRFCRKMLTTFGIFLLIIISFAIIVVATTAEKRANLLYPPVACDKFSERFSGSTIAEFRAAVVEDEMVGGPIPQNKTIKEGLLECYCQTLLAGDDVGRTEFYSPSPKWPTLSIADGYHMDRTENWCQDWLISFTSINALKMIGSVGAVVINLVLKWLLKRFVLFEKHHSLSDMYARLSTIVFISQLFNTALVVIIVNANLNYIDPNLSLETQPFFASTNLLIGEHQDFSSEWYMTVGVSLLFTMIINIAFPIMGPLMHAPSMAYARCSDRGCSGDVTVSQKKTQREFLELFIGPRLQLAQNYAVLMNTLFTCFIFASGMPLMYFICFITFFLAYWVDKWAFVSLYRIPENFDESIAQLNTWFLPIAALAHVMMGMWMFSNREIFPNGMFEAIDDLSGTNTGLSSFGQQSSNLLGDDALSRLGTRVINNTPHLLVLAVLLVVYFVFTEIVLVFFRGLLSVLCPCIEWDSSTVEGNPNFFKAREDGTLKGLKSYSIQDNNEYSRAFGIMGVNLASDYIRGYGGKSHDKRARVSSKDISGKGFETNVLRHTDSNADQV